MASSSESSGGRQPALQEVHEADRAPGAGGHAGGGDVGGGGDQRGVAAEAGAERERPPVGVVAAVAGLELLDDRDHRRGERDVVDEPGAERRDPGDAQELGGAVAAGERRRSPSATSLDRARLLERADHHEQAEEEEQGRPLDARQRALERLAASSAASRSRRPARRWPARGGAPCGRRTRGSSAPGSAPCASARRGPRSSAARRAPSRAGAPSAAIWSRGPVDEVEHARHDHERERRDRRQVDDEVAEREAGGAGDDDVGRVADQRGGAADVRGDDLDDHERDRVDVERVGQQEGDRHHQQDGGEVVEEGRQHGGRHRQRDDDRERPAARELAGADREPVVDAGRLGELDHQHHPGEQPDRVEVDRLDRLLLVDRLGEQHQAGADQRDLRAVDALAGDRRQREREDGDRERHQRSSRLAAVGDHQAGRMPSSRRSPTQRRGQARVARSAGGVARAPRQSHLDQPLAAPAPPARRALRAG